MHSGSFLVFTARRVGVGIVPYRRNDTGRNQDA